MCGFCNPNETDQQRTIRMMTERQEHRDQVGSIQALDNNPPDKQDIVSLVGKATGQKVNQSFKDALPNFKEFPPTPMLMGTDKGTFEIRERDARPAALAELRHAAEILEHMDGAGGLGDETKFIRLIAEALFMFDDVARKRMLNYLNSACA